MSEQPPFDDRLTSAVRAFADRARTQVDAVDVADRAIGEGGRRSVLRWPGTALPAAVWLLLIVGLLLVAFAWALGPGASHRGLATAVATATPSAAIPTVVPTLTPHPLSPAHVSGTAIVALQSAGETSLVDGETRVRGMVFDLQEDHSDPRVSGFGTLTLDTAGTPSMSYGSGEIQVDGADGTWRGTCTSASWDVGRAIALSCWLTGSGAYEGLTYFRYSLTSAGDNAFDGVIIAAPQPSP